MSPPMLIYIVQGSVMLVCNALVALAIVRTPKLHFKEYYVIAALATADALSGLAFVSAGVYRSALFYRGDANRRVLVASCLLVPHAPLFIVSQPLAALMLVCVSVDRLVAVAHPRRYFRLTAIYSRNMIGAFVIGSLMSSAAMIISSFVAGGLHATTAAICGGSAAVHSALGRQFYYGVRVVGGGLSVALFALVPLAYWCTRQALLPGMPADVAVQRRLVVTVGLSNACTLLFYVLPNVYRSAIVRSADDGSVLAHAVHEYSAVVQNLNCVCNIFIYFKRHADIRAGILTLFGLKPLVSKVSSARFTSSRRIYVTAAIPDFNRRF